jgi:hypothetical protein
MISPAISVKFHEGRTEWFASAALVTSSWVSNVHGSVGKSPMRCAGAATDACCAKLARMEWDEEFEKH